MENCLVNWRLLFVFNCSAGLGVLFAGNSLKVQFLGLFGIALCFLPIFRPSWLKSFFSVLL